VTRWLCVLGESSYHALSHRTSKDSLTLVNRIKPTTSAFLTQAYELTPTSLTLSDAHPNVQKRGGKSGREDEYTYTVGA
jgi:centromeric protein E